VQRFLLGVELRHDGSIVLAPTATEEFWQQGFGQTLKWRDCTLRYRTQRHRIAGTYTGGGPLRLGVRLAPGVEDSPPRAIVEGRPAPIARDKATFFITLPPARADQPARFDIRAGASARLPGSAAG